MTYRRKRLLAHFSTTGRHNYNQKSIAREIDNRVLQQRHMGIIPVPRKYIHRVC